MQNKPCDKQTEQSIKGGSSHKCVLQSQGDVDLNPDPPSC